jgi:hypothetical protein
VEEALSQAMDRWAELTEMAEAMDREKANKR